MGLGLGHAVGNSCRGNGGGGQAVGERGVGGGGVLHLVAQGGGGLRPKT
jgi:hypothetical protein